MIDYDGKKLKVYKQKGKGIWVFVKSKKLLIWSHKLKGFGRYMDTKTGEINKKSMCLLFISYKYV